MINIDFDDVNFDSDIDDVEFVDVDFDRGIRFADGITTMVVRAMTEIARTTIMVVARKGMKSEHLAGWHCHSGNSGVGQSC